MQATTVTFLRPSGAADAKAMHNISDCEISGNKTTYQSSGTSHFLDQIWATLLPVSFFEDLVALVYESFVMATFH